MNRAMQKSNANEKDEVITQMQAWLGQITRANDKL
jgi:hypothetical protein